jgi:hypothetical protein
MEEAGRRSSNRIILPKLNDRDRPDQKNPPVPGYGAGGVRSFLIQSAARCA